MRQRRQKFTKLIHCQHELGSGLLYTMVGLAIVGIIATVMMKKNSLALRSSKYMSQMGELDIIRSTLLSRVDCVRTLGITPNIRTPLACTGDDIVLRDKAGKPLTRFAGWAVSSSCEKKELIARVVRPGSDALRKKDWSKASWAKDLFMGESDICREWFDPGYCNENNNLFREVRVRYAPGSVKYNFDEERLLPNLEQWVPVNGSWRVNYRVYGSGVVSSVSNGTGGVTARMIPDGNTDEWWGYLEWPVSMHADKWFATSTNIVKKGMRPGQKLGLFFETFFNTSVQVDKAEMNLEFVGCPD